MPEDWKVVLTTEDMDLNINCTNCGKETTFGACYTSKALHNSFGLGYPVCEDCYNKEWQAEKEAEAKESESESDIS